MRYFSLFLPTTSSLPPEKTYKLWFDEFMNYWETFSNAPAWEVELFQVCTHNTNYDFKVDRDLIVVAALFSSCISQRGQDRLDTVPGADNGKVRFGSQPFRTAL